MTDTVWSVYIVECADGTLYTGLTTDLERRIHEHNNSELGAKYTRVRRPVRLIYSIAFPDRSSASKEEYRIKQMSRQAKLALVELGA